MIRVQREDFDLAAEYDRMTQNNTQAGAVVAFVGRVRDFQSADDDTEVTAITLDHYAGMTEKELMRIRDQAHGRWALSDSAIIHRIGRLEPGDQIVLVLTASAHRAHAFEAAQFLMDYLKTKAPFWKQEETGTGTRWVEAKQSDDEAAKKWEGE